MSAKKRKTSWNEKYSSEFGFIERFKEDEGKAFCKICNSSFSISHGGRQDILQHSTSKRHQSAIQAASSSKKVGDFFKKLEASNQDLDIAAKEATFAYHSARHNLSFRSNDCTSGLIKLLFEPKYTLGRTKCGAVIKKVLAPFVDEEMKKSLREANFVSLIIDTSNHNNLKMLPIIVRYFHPTKGISNKKISIVSIPNEQSTTIAGEVMKVVESEELKDKIVSLNADNTNLNFGGVRRNGQQNVWTKLKENLERNIFGVGCSAHIAHNSSSAACEMLDFDIENIVYKIYKHFKIYTVRTENFKQFCETFEVTYKQLQSHSASRFLSLAPAIRRFIELFKPLQEYFSSLDKCPPAIKDFFALKSNNFWLLFLENQMTSLSDTILRLERSSISAFEVAIEMKILKEKLKNRHLHSFMPRDARQEFEKFSAEMKNSTLDKIQIFYKTMYEYLELWEKSVDGCENLIWMQLYKTPDWKAVESTYEFLLDRFGAKLQSLINPDILFDEIIQLNTYVDEHKSNWIEDHWSADAIWKTVFNYFRENSAQLINLERMVEFGLSIPGTSVEAERVFSLINQYWTDEKSQADLSTINAVTSLQYNCDLTCSQFYHYLKKNMAVLEKVHSHEKYE